MYLVKYAGDTEHPEVFRKVMHSHDAHEIYLFLGGDADYFVEGSRYPLQPGDVMIMRRGEVHMAGLRSNLRYVRMGVHFDIREVLEAAGADSLMDPFMNRPAGTFNHYPAALAPGNHWRLFLQKIQDTEDLSGQLCYLMALLAELREAFPAIRNAEPQPPEPEGIAAVTAYINRHLSDELSLERVAEHFFLSKAHLNRLFQQSTGTTIWKYITLKRMQLARELIAQGTLPTQAALQCGYRDYATFYRAYCRQFGSSPRKSERNP